MKIGVEQFWIGKHFTRIKVGWFMTVEKLRNNNKTLLRVKSSTIGNSSCKISECYMLKLIILCTDVDLVSTSRQTDTYDILLSGMLSLLYVWARPSLSRRKSWVASGRRDCSWIRLRDLILPIILTGCNILKNWIVCGCTWTHKFAISNQLPNFFAAGILSNYLERISFVPRSNRTHFLNTTNTLP